MRVRRTQKARGSGMRLAMQLLHLQVEGDALDSHHVVTRSRAPSALRASELPARSSWRCAWCSRNRTGDRLAPDARETTGICTTCLGARRAVGTTRQGPGFVVWDEDSETAIRWADELRSVAASRRGGPRSAEERP